MNTATKRPVIDHDEIVEVEGVRFRVAFERDDDMGPPWKEHDGHGPVSDWRSKGPYSNYYSKSPGERLLCADDRDRSARFYDWQAAIKQAQSEGWGLNDDALHDLAHKLGREPTMRECNEEAVRRDFEYLRAWCNDEWEWKCIGVHRLDENGNDADSDYLGGCSGDDQYLSDTAWEMIDQMMVKVREERAAEATEKAELQNIATDMWSRVEAYLYDLRYTDEMVGVERERFKLLCAPAGVTVE